MALRERENVTLNHERTLSYIRRENVTLNQERERENVTINHERENVTNNERRKI